MVLVLLIAGLFLLGWQRQRALRDSFGEVALFQRLTPPVSPAIKTGELAFACLCVICAMLALARPQVSTPRFGSTGDAMDLIAVIDVSKSMAAEDYGTHLRLERGKEALLRLFHRLQPGTRMGLVTFAGASFRQADLTEDWTALQFILKHWVKVESVPIGGSELGKALDAAIAAFGKNERQRWILLLSDGGDWDDSLVTMARRAQRQGIPIVSIGLGGVMPAQIPEYDRQGMFRGYATHRGQTLTTALNEPTLIYLAEATGGRYVRIQSGAELAEVFAPAETPMSAALKWGELFQGLLLLSLLSLAATILCERGCPATRRQAIRHAGPRPDHPLLTGQAPRQHHP